MAMLLFLSQGHLGKGAARSSDFEDRVIAKALLPPGSRRDQTVATAFHLKQNGAIGGSDAERSAEMGLALL